MTKYFLARAREEEEERVGQAEADRQADRHGDLD